jgi:hypothetical protein
MSTLSERTVSLSARMPGERPRELQEVALVMIDGSEVRGMLHRAHGSRTLDFLNRQSEAFVAMTDAILYRNGDAEEVSFIALNKAHILRVIEGSHRGLVRPSRKRVRCKPSWVRIPPLPLTRGCARRSEC